MGGGGREEVYTLLAHFLLLWKQLGRAGGRRGGKGEGESRIWWGEGRGNEVPYSGSFRVFCDRTQAHENFFLQNFLADDKLRKSSTLSSSCG